MGKGYTKQFREQAIGLVTTQGYAPTRAARELGMPFSTRNLWLKRAGWRKPVDGGPVSEDPAVLAAEVKELRRQVRRLEMEKNILKRATAFFASQNLPASPSSIGDDGSSPVRTMCRVLNVARSGYYARRDRPTSVRAERRAAVTERIRNVFRDSRGTYGSPRVTVELKDQGEAVSENTVAKYMRSAGLGVTPERRFVPRTTDADHSHPVAANVLDRDFAAPAPNAKWVGG